MPRFHRPTNLSDEYSKVEDMAKALIQRFETHATLIDHHVKIDFMFAFADRDEASGEIAGNALTCHGVKALGIARKLPPKDRAKGLGDAEICLDGDWWADADEPERNALLDHELHHICATEKRDNNGRPVIKLRKHDFQFGWFNVIAARHANHSQERKQAAQIVEIAGQYFFPQFMQANGNSRAHNLEFDRDGDRLSPTISKAMATIGNAIKGAKQ